MSFDTLNACIQGYSDRMFDMQLVAVHSGFWSGFYTNSKRPKPLKSIIEKLIKARHSDSKKRVHSDKVDVNEFLRREAEFKARLQEMEKNRCQ